MSEPPLPIGATPRTIAACAAICLLSLLAWCVSDLRLNLSSSVPLGVYRLVAGSPHRGSTVLLCLPKPVAELARDRGYLRMRGNCPGNVSPVGKPVLALPGDTIVVERNAGLFVNGARIPNTRALARDEAGRMLPHFPDGTYPVASGQLWVASQYSSRSFDSRYFGPVEGSSVRSVIRPIWTLSLTH